MYDLSKMSWMAQLHPTDGFGYYVDDDFRYDYLLVYEYDDYGKNGFKGKCPIKSCFTQIYDKESWGSKKFTL